MARPTSRAGIALIEVLVSMVLIGVGVVTIVRALDTCVRSVNRTQDAAEAAMLLGEILLDATQVQPLKPGTELSGRFESPYEKFSWDAKCESMDESPFSRVTVTVRWKASKKERQVSAKRILLT